MDKDNMTKENLSAIFPPNRKMQPVEAAPEKTTDEKKLKKVVTGKVTKQKRSFGKKISEVLLEDNTKSVGSYIFYDVLIPAAKDLISDMVGGGIEMLLFGERRARGANHTIRSGGRSHTQYGSFFSSSIKNQNARNDKPAPFNRARHDFDNIVLESRGEAEEVLSHLVDLTIDYGQATVSDLYDLVGITSNFTDEKYGWTDLRGATANRARGGGYVLNLPRPQPLE